MDAIKSIRLNSLEDTELFAEVLAGVLRSGGLQIGFLGTLGAGKTTLIKYIVSKLGSNDSVGSPTFVLEHLYEAPSLSISHWDLYRLTHSPEELLSPVESNALRLIEWIDKAPELSGNSDLLINIDAIPDHTNSSYAYRDVKLSGELATVIVEKWLRLKSVI